MSYDFTDLIKQRAVAEGVEFEKLLETVLHRTFILEKAQFTETLDISVGQVQWHEAHAEAIKLENYTGSKYDPNLDILQIKRAVIEEIKKTEPGVKLSIRTRRHPDELNIDVKAAPYTLEDNGQLTKEAIALANRIGEVVKQYNFDHSDSWTDYCHSDFWSCITVLYRPLPLAPGEARDTLEDDPDMEPLDLGEVVP